MNHQRKVLAQQAASMFLDNMPADIWEKYQHKRLHEQLAFFFCWLEEMKDLAEPLHEN